MQLDLFVDYNCEAEACEQEAIRNLSLEEVADFIENRLTQNAIGFYVCKAKAVSEDARLAVVA